MTTRTIVGCEAALAWRFDADHARFVNLRPADGQTVSLNPPKFTWPYLPGIYGEASPDGSAPALRPRLFRFQVAGTPDFASPVIDVDRTPFNFQGTLKPLPHPGPWFWRVGDYEGENDESFSWRPTWRFGLGPDAVRWDRSMLAEPPTGPHPRVLFTSETLPRLRALPDQGGEPAEIRDFVLRLAGQIVESSWWRDPPETDRWDEAALRQRYPDTFREPVVGMFEDALLVNFAGILTGDERLLQESRERLVHFASWPIGGLSGPEGAPGSRHASVAQIIEWLALFYDWNYEALSKFDRRTVEEGLRWRVQFTLENFCWRQNYGRTVAPNSLSVSASSHPFESAMGLAAPGIALYELGEPFTTAYHLVANYVTAIGCPMGYEDGYNESPGYGNSKTKWWMLAASYLHCAVPSFSVAEDPTVRNVLDMLLHTAPLGLGLSGFGNGCHREDYVVSHRMVAARMAALLQDDPRRWRLWRNSRRYIETKLRVSWELRHGVFWSPWVQMGLSLRHPEPESSEPSPTRRCFPVDGFLAAATRPPEQMDRLSESVGVAFCARPRGGYQHSFFCDGHFTMHAYGQVLATGAGSGTNGDAFGYSSLSHNVPLVDGLGQSTPDHWRVWRPGAVPKQVARIAAYREIDEATTYWMGDLTAAYPDKPRHMRSWWGELDAKTYTTRSVPYLKRLHRHCVFVGGERPFFVIYDDVRINSRQRPAGARITWLYHIWQDVPVEWDQRAQCLRYRVGDVEVGLWLWARSEADLALEVLDLQGEHGATNPFTTEDYRATLKPMPVADGPKQMDHNLWFTGAAAGDQWWLAVIVPWRADEKAPVVARPAHPCVVVDGRSVSFAASIAADLVIDAEAISAQADRLRSRHG